MALTHGISTLGTSVSRFLSPCILDRRRAPSPPSRWIANPCSNRRSCIQPHRQFTFSVHRPQNEPRKRKPLSPASKPVVRPERGEWTKYVEPHEEQHIVQMERRLETDMVTQLGKKDGSDAKRERAMERLHAELSEMEHWKSMVAATGQWKSQAQHRSSAREMEALLSEATRINRILKVFLLAIFQSWKVHAFAPLPEVTITKRILLGLEVIAIAPLYGIACFLVFTLRPMVRIRRSLESKERK